MRNIIRIGESLIALPTLSEVEDGIKAFRRATMGGKYGPGFTRETTITILCALHKLRAELMEKANAKAQD